MRAHAALLVLLSGNMGCAAILNGFKDKVSAKSATPGARVYVDGFDATTAPAVVANDRAHILMVRAPGHDDRVMELRPYVNPVPIVLDVLLAIPTFGVAPLTDLCINSWTKIDSPGESIDLAPEVPTARPRPAYFVADRTVLPVSQGQAALPPPVATAASSVAAAPPVAAPPPQAAATQRPDVRGGCASDAECKGNRVCKAGQCVTPVPTAAAALSSGGCASDAECKGGRVCTHGQCSASPAPATPPAAPAGGCASDAECKGGRLCRAGRCTTGSAGIPGVTP